MLTDCCQRPSVKDLTNGLGADRNYYCMNCKSHWWRDTIYTSKQWDKMMNSSPTALHEGEL